MPETSRDTEVKETNQSGFDPAGVKSLLNVDERGEGVLMAPEAQGVHKAEGHSVGTPAETALGRVELWKNVGRKEERTDQALDNCERRKRRREMGRKESREVGSPSRLMTGTTELDFQVDGTTARRRTRLKKESRR